MDNKEELEQHIVEERPLGDFFFDEETQSFYTDTEVVYELVQMDEDVYYPGEYLYFDECEFVIEEEEKQYYYGTLEEVEEQLVKDYCQTNEFLGYPVLYTNFKVILVEK